MIRTNTVLELKNLSYIFPDHKGITDVSLKIKQGEIYMLYGGMMREKLYYYKC